MRIGVLGAGTMGTALARLFARRGHDVALGSRSTERARSAAALIPGARGGSYADAASGADVVALAVLWADAPHALAGAGPWSGRVLLDCTNPEPAEGRGLLLGHTTSGAEEIARCAEGARVVKALNHLYAETLDALTPDSPRPVAFACGDDPAAKCLVAGLLESALLEPVDAGPLSSARYLEPLAALMVELVRGGGRDPRDVAGLVMAARS